jgi:hypothetical protein
MIGNHQPHPLRHPFQDGSGAVQPPTNPCSSNILSVSSLSTVADKPGC